MVVLERDLEQHFSKECRRLGIPTLKLMVMGRRGWPDRLLVKNGQVHLVELKTLTGQVSPLQAQVHAQLKAKGVLVPILRTKQEITDYLERDPWPSA